MYDVELKCKLLTKLQWYKNGSSYIYIYLFIYIYSDQLLNSMLNE